MPDALAKKTTQPRSALRRALAPLAAVSPPLVGVFLAMLLVTCVALAGLAVDPRVITGAPAWQKPLKFALSVAIYSLSFAWLLGHARGWPRLRRWLGTLTAVTLAVEIAIIFLQAARGTTSHYNFTTPLDAALFQTMAIAIVVLWICQLIAAVLILRQPFDDAAFAWSLRLGILLTAAGAAIAFLMTTPSAEQIHAMAAHGSGILGAHTVGGADGGPGLPLTGWSRAHGDLRAAHFLGLHALQILPLVAWLVSRFGLDALTKPFSPEAITAVVSHRRARLVVCAGASYAGLLGLLVWQALRGQSIVAPDAATLVGLAAWGAVTVGAAVVALAVAPARRDPAIPAAAREGVAS